MRHPLLLPIEKNVYIVRTSKPQCACSQFYLKRRSGCACIYEKPGVPSTSTLDGLRRDLSNSGPLLMSTKSNKLPDYQPVCNSSFVWGNIDSASFAYKEGVHWKSNLFKIPQGNAGKSFTAELSHLFYAFATCSALEPIALKAATILPLLMLQKNTSLFKNQRSHQ